jgi:spermidine synthase
MSDHPLDRFVRERLQPPTLPAGLGRTWLTEELKGVAGYSLRVERTLHSERSDYQQIDLYQSYHHGKVLVLDGCVMLTELDEFLYHEMLAHTGAATLDDPRRAVVVGGGDGGAVRELLKYPSLEVTLAEIDERVVRLSQEHLPGVAGGLTDERCTLHFGDGAAYLAAQPEGSLDLVLVDSTDPVGPAEALVTEDFYREISRALRPDGVLVAQTQSPFYHPDEVVQIHATLQRVFKHATMFWSVCPAYLGFLWTFCYCSQERQPLAKALPSGLHKTLGTRFYSADVHRGAFALPPFLQACLPEGHSQRDL